MKPNYTREEWDEATRSYADLYPYDHGIYGRPLGSVLCSSMDEPGECTHNKSDQDCTASYRRRLAVWEVLSCTFWHLHFQHIGANTARAICVMRLSLLRRYRWLQSISFHKIGLYIHVCILVCSQQRFSGPYFVVRRASTVLRSSTVTITANFLLRLQKYI